MGRSWGFINWRWVTIRCPDNLFCPTQCGGSVSLLMGRMMTQLMPSWRGLTQHKQQRLNWCHQGGELAQTQTAKIQLMLSSSHYQWSKSTSISLPPTTLLTCQATLHPVNCPKCPRAANLWVAQCLEFILSLPRFLPILFYFVLSKIAHNQNFLEANWS